MKKLKQEASTTQGARGLQEKMSFEDKFKLLSIKSLTELLGEFDNYKQTSNISATLSSLINGFVWICSADEDDINNKCFIVNDDVHNEVAKLDNHLIGYENRIFFVFTYFDNIRYFVRSGYCIIPVVDTDVFNSHRVATVDDEFMAIKRFKKLK